jgi:hypothetical protein
MDVESNSERRAQSLGFANFQIGMPRPTPPDHPREDLLRRGSFQIRFIEPLPKNVDKSAFARWCATRLERLLPIHEGLVKELN